ncbi:MAG TPA: ABC transporter ATP-binding protein [Sphingobium sp.]|nr:ABC transporter ATP-binding protein [Sphingobium sp.]
MISFAHVSKRYDGRPVLDDVTLTIPPGAFVALVGASGAGKTTLLKAINRLTAIDSGTITVDGDNIASLPLVGLRRRIGYVFQGVGLFPHMSVADNVWLAPRLAGQSATGRDARVAELLAMVSLPANLAARYPRQLSGGQAQRVGFARALAAGPKIMLMDEPFGALDPVTRAELGTAYRALHERIGLTSLLVTHDMAEALILADRVIVLGEGRVLADRTPSALMQARADPAIRAMIDAALMSAARLDALARGD